MNVIKNDLSFSICSTIIFCKIQYDSLGAFCSQMVCGCLYVCWLATTAELHLEACWLQSSLPSSQAIAPPTALRILKGEGYFPEALVRKEGCGGDQSVRKMGGWCWSTEVSRESGLQRLTKWNWGLGASRESGVQKLKGIEVCTGRGVVMQWLTERGSWGSELRSDGYSDVSRGCCIAGVRKGGQGTNMNRMGTEWGVGVQTKGECRCKQRIGFGVWRWSERGEWGTEVSRGGVVWSAEFIREGGLGVKVGRGDERGVGLQKWAESRDLGNVG